MAESLGARVNRLIVGTASMLVTEFENMAPEATMEQAIREVEKGIDEVRHELGRATARAHLATKRLADENAKHQELEDKIQAALSSDREDLAEAAINQLLNIEAQIPILEEEIKSANEAIGELQAYVAALQGKKGEMQQELQNFRESKALESGIGGGSDAAAPGRGGSSVDTSVRNAEAAFNRVMGTATGLSAGGATISNQDAAKLAELDELSRSNRVQERLAAFKAKSE